MPAACMPIVGEATTADSGRFSHGKILVVVFWLCSFSFFGVVAFFLFLFVCLFCFRFFCFYCGGRLVKA